MRFEFKADEHVKVKTFLKKHEVSKGTLARLSFRWGYSGSMANLSKCDLSLRYWRQNLTIDIPAEGRV